MSYLVRKSEFAAMVNVSTANVSFLCRGRLASAVDPATRMIDVTHPAVIEYMNGDRHPDAKKTGPKPRKDFDPEELADLPQNVQEFANWTLNQIVKKFGSDLRFLDYLKSVKLIEEISEKELRNEERRGQLIPRDLVETHILGLVETSYTRLLSDSPKTITLEIINAAKAGETPEDIEKRVRELISSQIKSIKKQAVKALRNA